jgi:hypothetical protein
MPLMPWISIQVNDWNIRKIRFNPGQSEINTIELKDWNLVRAGHVQQILDIALKAGVLVLGFQVQSASPQFWGMILG